MRVPSRTESVGRMSRPSVAIVSSIFWWSRLRGPPSSPYQFFMVSEARARLWSFTGRDADHLRGSEQRLHVDGPAVEHRVRDADRAERVGSGQEDRAAGLLRRATDARLAEAALRRVDRVVGDHDLGGTGLEAGAHDGAHDVRVGRGALPRGAVERHVGLHEHPVALVDEARRSRPTPPARLASGAGIGAPRDDHGGACGVRGEGAQRDVRFRIGPVRPPAEPGPRTDDTGGQGARRRRRASASRAARSAAAPVSGRSSAVLRARAQRGEHLGRALDRGCVDDAQHLRPLASRSRRGPQEFRTSRAPPRRRTRPLRPSQGSRRPLACRPRNWRRRRR